MRSIRRQKTFCRFNHDYILVMKQGSIVEEGETRAILEHPEPYSQQLFSSVLDIGS